MASFRNKRLFILLISIIILLGLIGFSLKDRENISAPEQFIQDTVAWGQKIVNIPIIYMTDVVSNIKEFKNTYEENRVLKEKISEYKTLIYDMQELKKDNEELRNTLDKTESITDFNPIQATVTSRSPERWIQQITINKGTKDGVEPNMAVITADGMIGKILSASHFTSTIQLLTGFDEFNRISASITQDKEKGKDKEVFGLIEKYDEKSHSLSFRIIEESDQNVEKGDLVVSSGMGGVFPAGLPIGTVKEVVPDQYGLTSTALVKPAADMYSINHVIVVDRSLVEKEDLPDEEEEE